MLADYHVHTDYSDDSTYPMEDVVTDAIEKGLDEICFTDHVDYGVKRDWDDPLGVEYHAGGPGEPERIAFANVDYPRYVAQIDELQARYEGRIRIKLGLEFGMQAHTIPQYQRLFSSYPFDFIILSIHEVGDKELWTQDFQRGLTQQEYNERYYEAKLELVRTYHDYSVLGHLDLITRYDLAGVYPFERVRPIIEEILKVVIADGKGIELNTSSFKYKLRDTMPSRAILQLYHELGGHILTIGSDTHETQHLADHFPEVRRLLREIGFNEFCTFQQRQPIFHRL